MTTLAHQIFATSDPIQTVLNSPQAREILSAEAAEVNEGSLDRQFRSIWNAGNPFDVKRRAKGAVRACHGVPVDSIVAFIPGIHLSSHLVARVNAFHLGVSFVDELRFYGGRKSLSLSKFDASSQPRCIACGRLQGLEHATGCWVAILTIGRAH